MPVRVRTCCFAVCNSTFVHALARDARPNAREQHAFDHISPIVVALRATAPNINRVQSDQTIDV